MDNAAQTHPTTPTNSQDESLPDIDDLRDSSYVEPPAAADAAKITPLQRKGIAEEFSTAAKKRVDKIDGHQGHCIVTNTPEFNCVQYAHLLPRAATPELVSHHTMLCLLVQLRHYNITAVRTTWIFLGYEIWKLARRQPLQCHAAWVPWCRSISLGDLLEIKSMFIYTPFLTGMPGFYFLRKKS